MRRRRLVTDDRRRASGQLPGRARAKNIFAVVSGSPERVEEWRSARPERVLPGLELLNFGVDVSPDSLRRLASDGRVRVLAEVSSQYRGLAPDQRRAILYAAARFLRLSEEEIRRHHGG